MQHMSRKERWLVVLHASFDVIKGGRGFLVREQSYGGSDVVFSVHCCQFLHTCWAQRSAGMWSASVCRWRSWRLSWSRRRIRTAQRTVLVQTVTSLRTAPIQALQNFRVGTHLHRNTIIPIFLTSFPNNLTLFALLYPGDSNRVISDLKFKLVKAEQESTALEQNVSPEEWTHRSNPDIMRIPHGCLLLCRSPGWKGRWYATKLLQRTRRKWRTSWRQRSENYRER